MLFVLLITSICYKLDPFGIQFITVFHPSLFSPCMHYIHLSLSQTPQFSPIPIVLSSLAQFPLPYLILILLTLSIYTSCTHNYYLRISIRISIADFSPLYLIPNSLDSDLASGHLTHPLFFPSLLYSSQSR